MQGKHILALIAMVGLVPTAALANAQPKKPTCQATKVPSRDFKKGAPCRKSAPIPWVVDQTPLFLASASAAPRMTADLS